MVTGRPDCFPSPAPAELFRHLRTLEESLLQPDIRPSAELLALLADEFIELGSLGRVYTKADLVAVLPSFGAKLRRRSTRCAARSGNFGATAG